jgi:hypothetical protein
MAATNPIKSLQNSCDLVINSLRASSLNYNLQETPFLIYLSIRKSFSTVPTLVPEVVVVAQIPTENKSQDILEDLKSNLKSAETANFALKHKYEDAVNDSEQSYSKIKLL